MTFSSIIYLCTEPNMEILRGTELYPTNRKKIRHKNAHFSDFHYIRTRIFYRMDPGGKIGEHILYILF
jgi:hypothetical protein